MPDIYDSIAEALNLPPIEFIPDYSGYFLEHPPLPVLHGKANPMYGQKRPDLADYNKTVKKNSSISNSHKLKISSANTGENNPMFGKKHSEESKRKMSENSKGKSGRSGELNSMFGKKGELSPLYGKKRPETVKKRVSEAMRNAPKMVCPHCNISTNKGNYFRWHGDNCKSANNKS